MKTNLAATTALASSLVLLAAIGLPAKAAPLFDLKSAAGATTGMIELIGHGGGKGGGGGGGGGAGNAGHMSGGNAGHISGGGDGGHNGHSMSAMGHSGHNGGDHMGHHGHHGPSLAWKGGDWDNRGHHGHHGPSVAWKDDDWDHHGHDHDHDHFDHHHHHHNFFADDIFFLYGAGYGYGDCYWLRRQAIITGSPYWWQRYQECLYYY